MSRDWSFDAKDVVRRAVDIVDLVGQYLQLRRSGRNYVALCPWHDDSRPSLQVNPERQSFKCWVCDIGGDVFSFLMKMEGVTFPEALEMLADRAGVELAPHRPAAPSAEGQVDFKRQLYQVMAWAADQYHNLLLRSPEAAVARDYLRERGISDESVARFKLGFAPDAWTWLADRGSSAGFSAQALETTGLLARREGATGHYDRFRGRVLFTIRDTQARPVALGGRVLPALASTSPAKYINSPETPLFSKSNLVYGLDLARETCSRTKRVIVVEGYTDVIIAHQAGFTNTVAVLGTALGERHIRLLKRYADQIVLVLDGDEAGQRRTDEVLELFVANQVDLRICTLPDGLDPCDFLLGRGAESFAGLIDGAVDALEHRLTKLSGADARSGTHAAHQALEQVLGTLAKAPRLTAASSSAARLREEQILHRLSRLFEIPEEVLRERLRTLRGLSASRISRAEHEENANVGLPELDAWERELLELITQVPQCIERVLQRLGPDQIGSELCRQIVLTCRDLWENEGEIEFSRLLLAFDDQAMKSLLVDLDERGREKHGDRCEERLEALLESFVRRREEGYRRQQLAALRERRIDDQQGVEILLEAIQRGRARHSISDSTDG